MAPTFNEGDIIHTQKIDTNKLVQKDVILLKIGKQKMIKRVHGIPGDELEIIKKKTGCHIKVNKELISFRNKAFLFSDKSCRMISLSTIGNKKIINDFFVLGDNLKASKDSRKFGLIAPENILGITFLRQ